jgi:hypothetical protein
LKEVKEAGRWKSMAAVLIYSHLEHNEVDERTRESGDNWLKKTTQKADVIAPSFRANSGLGKQGSDK